MSTLNDKKTSAKDFISLIGLPIAFIINIFEGFVFMKLWDWFVIPTFHSAPHIGVIIASGFFLILNFATFHYVNPRATLTNIITSDILVCLFALLTGLCLTLFM